jgi:hypothetical protein
MENGKVMGDLTRPWQNSICLFVDENTQKGDGSVFNNGMKDKKSLN